MPITREWFFIYFALIGILFCQCLLPLAKRVGTRLKMFDQPGRRKVHTRPMLRTGGMVLYFSFVLILLVHLAFFYLFSSESWFQNNFSLFISNMERIVKVHQPLMALLFGSTIIYLLGFYDDRETPSVTVKIKWIIQVLAALIALWGGIQVTFTGIPVLDKLITVLWIVGITNAFNLLDNMNGLSAGVALVASALFFMGGDRSRTVFHGPYLISLYWLSDRFSSS